MFSQGNDDGNRHGVEVELEDLSLLVALVFMIEVVGKILVRLGFIVVLVCLVIIMRWN